VRFDKTVLGINAAAIGVEEWSGDDGKRRSANVTAVVASVFFPRLDADSNELIGNRTPHSGFS